MEKQSLILNVILRSKLGCFGPQLSWIHVLIYPTFVGRPFSLNTTFLHQFNITHRKWLIPKVRIYWHVSCTIHKPQVFFKNKLRLKIPKDSNVILLNKIGWTNLDVMIWSSPIVNKKIRPINNTRTIKYCLQKMLILCNLSLHGCFTHVTNGRENKWFGISHGHM